MMKIFKDEYSGTDPAVQKMDNPVCEAGIPFRVRDHDDRRHLLIQFAKQFHHLRPVRRIQVTRRFVGEDQRAVRHHGARYRHTLLLSAR